MTNLSVIYCTKKEKIQEQKLLIEQNHDDKAADDQIDSIEELTKYEEATLHNFYKKMWNNAGTEEFKKGLKEASEILKNYNKFGKDSIKDKEIKKIILDAQKY